MKGFQPPLEHNTNNVLFTGYSIMSIMEMMENFPRAEFYDIDLQGQAAYPLHRCRTTAQLQPTIDRILSSIDQINITEYQR